MGYHACGVCGGSGSVSRTWWQFLFGKSPPCEWCDGSGRMKPNPMAIYASLPMCVDALQAAIDQNRRLIAECERGTAQMEMLRSQMRERDLQKGSAR